MSELTWRDRVKTAAVVTAVGIPVVLIAVEVATSAGVEKQFAIGLGQSLLMPLPFVGWAMAGQVRRAMARLTAKNRGK